MTLIDEFLVMRTRKGCAKAISAFRNIRDLAKQYRTQFIQEAIARAPVGRAPAITAAEKAAQVMDAAAREDADESVENGTSNHASAS